MKPKAEIVEAEILKWALLISAFSFQLSALPATFTAASTSRADVLAAYNLASLGDIVAIPAGTSTWFTPITINKGITITGLTTNVTVLYNGNSSLDSHGNHNETPMFEIALDTDVPLTVKHIRFRAVGAENGNGITASQGHAVVPTKIRITECVFQQLNFSLAIGAAFGVCDNCDFINNRLVMRYPGIYSAANLKQIPAPPWPFNTTNTFVIEDCHASIDSSVSYQYFGDTELPASYTIRYCKFDRLKSADYDGWDMHGDDGFSQPSANAYYRIGAQIYSNLFTLQANNNYFRLFDCRGGENTLCYSNLVVNNNGTVIDFRCDASSCNHKLQNTYVWANFQNGGSSPITIESANGVTEGVNFFTFKPTNFAQLTYPHPLRGASPPPDPNITVQPQTQIVQVGQSATFNVTATGNTTVHYQWKYNGANVGSDQNSYTKTNPQLTDNEASIQVTVSDAAGSLDSDIVMLNVTTVVPKMTFSGTLRITGVTAK